MVFRGRTDATSLSLLPLTIEAASFLMSETSLSVEARGQNNCSTLLCACLDAAAKASTRPISAHDLVVAREFRVGCVHTRGDSINSRSPGAKSFVAKTALPYCAESKIRRPSGCLFASWASIFMHQRGEKKTPKIVSSLVQRLFPVIPKNRGVRKWNLLSQVNSKPFTLTKRGVCNFGSVVKACGSESKLFYTLCPLSLFVLPCSLLVRRSSKGSTNTQDHVHRGCAWLNLQSTNPFSLSTSHIFETTAPASRWRQTLSRPLCLGDAMRQNIPAFLFV